MSRQSSAAHDRIVETMPDAPVNAVQANAHAREVVRSGETNLHRMCLKFVRECWGLPAKYPTAAIAWDNAESKHPFRTVEVIPYGAPVFSQRPDAGDDDSGHVFLAGGYTRKGVRIFRSTDIHTLGGVSVCTIEDLQEKWGHKILGWTSDLNGYDLHLPAIPKDNN